MAKGLPVVAADTASNREVAGNAGSFFPSFDLEALARMLGRIIDDPLLRRRNAAAALERAQDFSGNVQRGAHSRAAASNCRLKQHAMQRRIKHRGNTMMSTLRRSRIELSDTMTPIHSTRSRLRMSANQARPAEAVPEFL